MWISFAHSTILGLLSSPTCVWRSAPLAERTENGYPSSAFTRPWPNSVELIIAQVARITSSPETIDLSLSAHLWEHTLGYSKNKVYFLSPTPRHSHSSFLHSCSCVCAVERYNTRVTLLSAFVARILLWYSSSPRQAWTCRFFFFLPPLPLGRKARSWEIKGIARRPHERQRCAALLNSPERLFQSKRPDQQRQDPQGRGAGRRSLGRIKVPGPKLGEKLHEVNVLDFLFISIYTVCEAKSCL